MNEIAILVKPIDYPLDLEKLETCFNCGSTVFRVQKEHEGDHEDIELYCAQCGTHVLGYCLPNLEEEKKSENVEKEEK